MIDAWCLEDGFGTSRVLSMIPEESGALADHARDLISFYGFHSTFRSSEAFAGGVPGAICLRLCDFVSAFTDDFEYASVPSQVEVTELAAAVVVFAETHGTIGHRTLNALESAHEYKLMSPALADELLMRARQIEATRPFDGSVKIILDDGSHITMPSLGLADAQALSDLARDLSDQSDAFPMLVRGNVRGWVATINPTNRCVLRYAFELRGFCLKVGAKSDVMRQLISWRPEHTAAAVKDNLMYALPSQ